MLPAVVARNLGKQYSKFSPERTLTFHEGLLSGWRHVRATERYWVLKGINITLMPGEMLGVIGKNGAGKSTLLKVLSGVLKPDEGVLSVNGRIGSFLRLGGSFHPELTGRENAYTEGVLSGLTKAEMDERMDEIIKFANLDEFIDNPLRTYSNGMTMRLGFAVAVHTDPKVLFMDEHLAVGDAEFVEKCLAKIREMRQEGCAFVLVTHGLDRVRQHCSAALWLHHGQVIALGESHDVVEQYQAFNKSGDAIPTLLANLSASTSI